MKFRKTFWGLNFLAVLLRPLATHGVWERSSRESSEDVERIRDGGLNVKVTAEAVTFKAHSQPPSCSRAADSGYSETILQRLCYRLVTTRTGGLLVPNWALTF
jgi:hypothetical protein